MRWTGKIKNLARRLLGSRFAGRCCTNSSGKLEVYVFLCVSCKYYVIRPPIVMHNSTGSSQGSWALQDTPWSCARGWHHCLLLLCFLGRTGAAPGSRTVLCSRLAMCQPLIFLYGLLVWGGGGVRGQQQQSAHCCDIISSTSLHIIAHPKTYTIPEWL